MIRNSSPTNRQYWFSGNRMLSRRSITVLAFAAVSLFLLFVSSKRLDWATSTENPYYHHQEPATKAPSGPSQSAPEDKGTPGSSHQSSEDFFANSSASDWKLSDDTPPRPGHDPVCASFPDTSNILLVMKTGASEAYDKIPTQLMTMLKCLPDFLIYSDMDQHIAGYHIHDSLSTVLESAKEGNRDFDLYRRQQACLVDQDSCNKLGNPASEGWNLDKYKNVHIAEKAYNLRPNYDWYVFVDADTYVLWPNLVTWLKKLNPKKHHYLGSVTLIHDFSFGHGGSGYVVSQSAMKDFVGKNPGIANKFDEMAKGECCGDYMFAYALHNTTEVKVHQVWPTINGEKPATLPFGPSHWCHPIVTMHHMNSEEISTFWEFERQRYAKQDLPSTPPPLVLKDIFYGFLSPKLKDSREDWDNLSDDRYYINLDDKSKEWESWQKDRMKNKKDYNDAEKKAHESFEACGKACESVGTNECFQYMYRNGACSFSNSFKLGHPVKKSDKNEERSMSGWDVKKIRKWIEDQGDCKNPKWPDVRD